MRRIQIERVVEQRVFLGVGHRIVEAVERNGTRLMVGHAFETMNLNRVWLHVYEFNEAGGRAYEKVGFHKEGVLRQDVYREGRYWDTIVMGIQRMLAVPDSTPAWHTIMATATLALLPPALVVVIMRRAFVRGLIDSEK